MLIPWGKKQWICSQNVLLWKLDQKESELIQSSESFINCITKLIKIYFSPGLVKTDIYQSGNATIEQRDNHLAQTAKEITLRRTSEVEDNAKHIAFLASGDSSWITGTNLLDDGGMISSVMVG